MKYLLNLPLAVAALLQVWFASLVFMPGPWSYDCPFTWPG
jgi:hypothetical protein